MPDRSFVRPLAAVLVLFALALSGAEGNTPKGQKITSRHRRELRFAARMATSGLWREALFRWERLAQEFPQDPRLWNNIAVAKEALGDQVGARAAYQRALDLSQDVHIQANAALQEGSVKEVTPAAPSPPPPEPDR